jgi:hypothetical protein
VITRTVTFSCDDHNHEDEEHGGPVVFTNVFITQAMAEAKTLGWTAHRDGRVFCPKHSKQK